MVQSNATLLLDDLINDRGPAMEGSMWRFALAICFLQASWLWPQATVEATHASCAANTESHATYWYAQEAMKVAVPSDKAQPLILISVTLNAHSKLILQATGDGRFELSRGTLPKKVYGVLEDLEKSCQLPADSHQVAKLLPFSWQTKELTADEFASLHADFISAFSALMSDARRRYRSILTNGGVTVLHTPEYLITYDNSGYEHTEALVDDIEFTRGEVNPMVAWVHRVMALSGQDPQKKTSLEQ